MDQHVATTDRADRLAGPIVALLAAAVALVSARPYAGGWNDGSRLATVESLVDQQALEIDRSMFVRGPGSDPAAPNPYTPGDELLAANGTRDKLFIRDKDSVNGHFYSDKSPLPAVTLAGWYLVLKRTINLDAREDPGRFCYWMTVGSSGLGYVAAVWCVYQMGLVVGLPLSTRLWLTASLAFATVALAYTRHVNNHAMLLGVTAALVLSLARLAREIGERRTPWSRLLEAGTLMGLGYSIDLGVGPPLVLATTALVVWRTRRLTPIVVFVLAAAPWIAGHHALNYYIGGTFAPANSVPDYFKWPGSSFTPENMTGGWAHKSIAHFLFYALDLLVGKHGFLSFNLPMFLAVAGFFILWRRRPSEWPELLFCAAFSVGAWLMYSVASVDHSGECCSVRWFVPLLAPGYYVMAVLLREQPAYRCDFLLLSGFSAMLGATCWWHGPWYARVPLGWGFWVIYSAALVAWGGCELARRRTCGSGVSVEEGPQA
jgi:hypothetical protein